VFIDSGGWLSVVIESDHRVSEVLWVQAEEIFAKYADVRVSFTDYTSFALIHKHPVDEVFGFDAHFEMMGHVLQPKR
jgi:predicted nucleic acid-binding protein